MGDLLEDLLKEDHNNFKREDEVLAPLLPAIDRIHDGDIRSFVRSVLVHAPPYFWTLPGDIDDDDDCLPDEVGSGGNILHILRVARLTFYLAHAQNRTERERDILLAAALLHTVTKGVEELDGSIGFDPMHMYTVDAYVDWVREHDERFGVDRTSSTLTIDDEALRSILRLIRCQNGAWSPIPETFPTTDLESAFHVAVRLSTKLHSVIDGVEIKPWRWKEPGNEQLKPE